MKFYKTKEFEARYGVLHPLWRQRQKDLYEIEVPDLHGVPGQPRLHIETLSQKKKSLARGFLRTRDKKRKQPHCWASSFTAHT